MHASALLTGLATLAFSWSIGFAQQAPSGQIKGNAVQHTSASAAAVVQRASIVLPSQVTGGAIYVGTYSDAPKLVKARVPVIVFLHGSSGLGLKAIGEWQQWLASLGVASIAPDSFALPDRVTYTSPVSKEFYEKIHALRASEIGFAVQALRNAEWADTSRLVLAGTSEGATSVARYAGSEFLGRIIYSWSCEDNYFVERHGTALPQKQSLLNIISSTDPFFSPSNSWLGSVNAKGHCGDAFKEQKSASIVLIAGAPHTLINLPTARHATAGFVRDVLNP